MQMPEAVTRHSAGSWVHFDKEDTPDAVVLSMSCLTPQIIPKRACVISNAEVLVYYVSENHCSRCIHLSSLTKRVCSCAEDARRENA